MPHCVSLIVDSSSLVVGLCNSVHFSLSLENDDAQNVVWRGDLNHGRSSWLASETPPACVGIEKSLGLTQVLLLLGVAVAMDAFFFLFSMLI